ncbi:hypothetical protein [Mycobacterium avium]|uniref:Uncharacterized protein n=2 Tax=Mycobacterium avium TaxID=1764 RepID=A0A2A3L859_MYCAV|nr:hypothetical protein [Mycobacterium avium]ANR91329.1 hypothetical protein BBJ32_08610 [Mycobacterium avium]ATO69332.1 hypothetical protein BJP78_22420 [Mycobacterium avium subsp. hominissuis]AXO21424.1 hypothetical protein DFS55_01605 [Mycobacterium avium subsp. hominissuis]AYJ07201.1 hypothetical protein DBO90_22080 [Mycobacterium avium]MBG0727011.1 hypothetical protein [Mycobacterium avium]
MRGQGHQIFVDELARFAAAEADPRVTAIAQRAAAPLRVVVRGRRGVGRRTLARALDRAGRATGIAVTTDAADVVVHVTAEVAKPEDTQAISTARAAGHPVLAVLSKADLVGSLSGRGGDGPIAAARARCADLSALIGVPIRPAIGLLAVAALDDLGDDLWAALRTLAADPAACLDGSITGFLDAGVDVPAAARERLLDTLDLFGTALAIAAIRRGAGPAQLRTMLRRISGVDAVLAEIGALGAEVRYRRVLGAVAELEALAVGGAALGERISGFLSRDDTVVARMAAALDMAGDMAGEVAGEAAPGDPSGHLARAVRWQRYSRASGSDLHRACGADIARGSLRLWSQACATLPGERPVELPVEREDPA